MATQRRFKYLFLAVIALGAVLLTACETHIDDHNRSMWHTNDTRRGARVAPLETNVHLITTADRWAAQMRDEWVRGGCTNRSAILRHTSDLRAHHQPQNVTRQWRALGENVGVTGVINGNRAAAIDELHQAYVASPSHRANMVDSRYRWTGHALVYGPTAAQSAAGYCPGVPVNSVVWSAQAYVG